LTWRFCAAFLVRSVPGPDFLFRGAVRDGPRDFASGAQKEYARVKSFVVKRTEEIGQNKKDR
jgi:hypothetical protein